MAATPSVRQYPSPSCETYAIIKASYRFRALQENLFDVATSWNAPESFSRSTTWKLNVHPFNIGGTNEPGITHNSSEKNERTNQKRRRNGNFPYRKACQGAEIAEQLLVLTLGVRRRQRQHRIAPGGSRRLQAAGHIEKKNMPYPPRTMGLESKIWSLCKRLFGIRVGCFCSFVHRGTYYWRYWCFGKIEKYENKDPPWSKKQQ